MVQGDVVQENGAAYTVLSAPSIQREVGSTAESDAWPMPMCCSCFYGPFDLGLCCYSYWCTLCAVAEISEKVGVGEGYINQGTCGEQCCFVYWGAGCTQFLCSVVLAAYGAPYGLSYCVTPWIHALYYTQVRNAFKLKFGLPHDEFCCDSSLTTHQPIVSCTLCAVYQEAYYLKHRKKNDFDCFCYNILCRPCKQPTNVSLDPESVELTEINPITADAQNKEAKNIDVYEDMTVTIHQPTATSPNQTDPAIRAAL